MRRGILARQDLLGSSELLSAYVFVSRNLVTSSLLSTFFIGNAITMSLLAVNTVDRLDRPSAYYVGKVGFLLEQTAILRAWAICAEGLC